MLKTLLGKQEISDSYINFQIDLSKIHQKIRNQKKLIDPTFPNKETIQDKLETGEPLIIFTPLSFSQKALFEGYKNLVRVFTSHKLWTKDIAEWFEKKSNNLFIKKLFKAIISFDVAALQKLAEATPVEEATLALLGRELVKPFLKSFAIQAGKDVTFENWREGFCPICGDTPTLALLSKDEEGKRHLWCARCEFAWTFPRITCPSCKNKDHTKLRFLTTNFREELRIDVCEVCKGYVKTIDERKGDQEEKADFFKENIASLYLDVLAEDEGYFMQPPLPRETKIKFLTG